MADFDLHTFKIMLTDFGTANFTFCFVIPAPPPRITNAEVCDSTNYKLENTWERAGLFLCP